MYVTVDAVAEHLGVTRQTAYKWARQGIIPCTRLGRTVKFVIEDIDRKLEEDRDNGCEAREAGRD